MKILLLILGLFFTDYTTICPGSLAITYTGSGSCPDGTFKVVNFNPGCGPTGWCTLEWLGLNPNTFNWENIPASRGFYLCHDPNDIYTAWRLKITVSACNCELYSNIIFDNYF